MGTRTDYFCDFCDHDFPYHKLVPFHVSCGKLVVSQFAAEGEKHICGECLIVIAAARDENAKPETILDEPAKSPV